jgi:serine/threonine protein kinase
MSPDRLLRIEELYHASLEREPSEREAFLSDACQGDVELMEEIQSLLAQQSGSVLDGPAWQQAHSLLGGHALTPGAQLGPYSVLGVLGSGGMGEVYRAHDARLRRGVAIKVLPEHLARDPHARTRFEREARAVAALSHSNICTLYDVGPDYLVMELVEGPTLASRIALGAIPLKETLGIARQIADALEAAHEKGVVHRDLKPGNIKIKLDGTVKVLDFGLAKISDQGAIEGGPTDSPTLTMEQATRTGMLLGTAAYMSPEQAMGKPVDKRADIWSFGVVLWEMFTGHRLFEGETVSQTLADVLRGSIDFEKLPRESTPAIRRLLRRCLERDVKNRLRDIGEARITIESTLAGETELNESPSGSIGGRGPRLPWSITALLGICLAGLSFLYFRGGPAVPAALVRAQIPAPENTSPDALLSLSPDGRKLAFYNQGRVGVYFLESRETRDLASGDGTPFWSKDGRFIGYPDQRKLKKIEATGGPSQTVAEFGRLWGGGAWNQDDQIVFSDRYVGLFQVPASGGVPVQITAVDLAHEELLHYNPYFLSDGRQFVYTRASTDQRKNAIYLGSLDAKPEQQSPKVLVTGSWQSAYTPSANPRLGYLLFVRHATLMAQPFDNRQLQLTGQAMPIAEQISDSRSFSVSANDVLIYQRSAPTDKQLVWYDRAGKMLTTVGAPDDYGEQGEFYPIALSPDQTKLAVTKRTERVANIWLLDLLRGGTSTRFTFDSASDIGPVWSPDGSSIVFSSNRDGHYDLYQKPTNGATAETALLKSNDDKWATSWSVDGRYLLYTAIHAKGKQDIWLLLVVGDKNPIPFPITEFNEREARFSPDGHWVAYTSDESGSGTSVYVRSFQ